MLYGSWTDCLEKLKGAKFDCILVTNLLHLQANLNQLVRSCSQLVGANGFLIVGGPNFNRLPWLIKRVAGIGDFGKLRSFKLSGISLCGSGMLTNAIEEAGLRIANVQWLNHTIGRSWAGDRRLCLGSLTARDWILRACPTGPA